MEVPNEYYEPFFCSVRIHYVQYNRLSQYGISPSSIKFTRFAAEDFVSAPVLQLLFDLRRRVHK